MKKTLFGLVILTLMFSTSCKKNSTSSSNYWTFKGTTYNTATCGNLAGVLEAISTYGTLNVDFYNNPPTTPGTYTYLVASGGTAAAPTEVGVQITTGTNNPIYYFSTGGNGSNQHLTLTVASDGRISATATGIMVSDSSNPSDSSTVTLSVTQTF